jgi:hypothetical protein
MGCAPFLVAEHSYRSGVGRGGQEPNWESGQKVSEKTFATPQVELEIVDEWRGCTAGVFRKSGKYTTYGHKSEKE